MNTERITKALSSASQVLKGTIPDGVDAQSLTDALLELGDTCKRVGETREQAFTRLIREGDADAALLSRAIDALFVADQYPNVERRTAKQRLHTSATDQLDQHVMKHRRDGETIEQATARLACESESEPGFIAIWSQLRAVQDSL